jgi:xylulokinase
MEAPIFLPYLSGERTPHNNAEAKGVLFGLTHEHDAAAVAYSVLEGVSFGMRDGLLALQISKSPATLELVGGGSKSNAWAQLLATVLDVRLRVTTGNEAAAALGAARLGWCAAGGDPHEVASTAEGPSVTYLPDPDAWDLLRSRYRRFGELYTAVNPAFNDREVPI